MFPYISIQFAKLDTQKLKLIILFFMVGICVKPHICLWWQPIILLTNPQAKWTLLYYYIVDIAMHTQERMNVSLWHIKRTRSSAI